MQSSLSRWVRLERYSRWRQRRLRLDHLPNDVVLNVIGYLCHDDLCSLLNALYAVPRFNVESRVQANLVPIELRAEWLYGAACDGLRRTLYSIGEIALFHARSCSRVCAHVDWSVFSGPVMPVPICVYDWSQQCSANVAVNEIELWRVVRNKSTTGCMAVTIALYTYLWWGGSWIIHPVPCHRLTYPVFPYFLASESMHCGLSWKEKNARIGDSHSSCLPACPVRQ